MSFQFSVNNLRFEDIRNEIISYLKANGNFSGSFDYKGSNIATMIDSMAYVTMMLSYQVSNIANNAFLDSSNIRKNAVSLAKNIGYKPRRPVSAKLAGTFKYYGENFSPGDEIILDPKTPFYSNTGRQYINLDTITMKYTGNPTYLEGDYILYEGTLRSNYFFGTSQAAQTYTFAVKNADENYFNLYVYGNNVDLTLYNKENYKWQYAKTFSAIKDIKNQHFYFLEEDVTNEGFTKIIFGDGNVGAIPQKTDIIEVEYLDTVGSIANGEYLTSLPDASKFYASEQLRTKYDWLGVNLDKFDTSYKNTYNIAYGGADLETIDSIKINAPRFFSRIGRLITKNDYYSYLLSLTDPIIKAANVVGEDEFSAIIPRSTYGGNIFITAVPPLPTSIDTTYKFYLTTAEEQKIIAGCDEISVLSTTRKFLKPSYIYMDVWPSIELPNDVPSTEATLIQNGVRTLLQNYITSEFSELGRIFRKSKLHSAIDYLPSLISSRLDMKYFFLINEHSFYSKNDIRTSNFIYLPVIAHTKDSETGFTTSYRNFVMKNTDLIDEKILEATGRNIVEEINTSTAAASAAYKTRLEYNERLLPSEHTIYGPIYHPFVDRVMYNNDVVESTIFDIKVTDAVIQSIDCYSFYDVKGNLIVPALEEISDNVYNVVFYNRSATGSAATFRIIGTMTFIPFNESFVFDLNTGYKEEFGFIDGFNGDFIVQYDDINFMYAVKIRLIGNGINSNIVLDSTNRLFSFNFDQAVDTRYKNQKAFSIDGTTYNIELTTTEPTGATFKLNNTELGKVQINEVPYLKGYITSQAKITDVVYNEQPGSACYYIIPNPDNSWVYTDPETNDAQFIGQNKILFFNTSTSAWDLKGVIKNVDATLESSLLINFDDGEPRLVTGEGSAVSGTPESILTPVASGDYIVFDTESSSATGYWNKTTFSTIPLTALDASKILPVKAERGDIRLVVNLPTSADTTNFGGRTLTYFEEDDLIAFIPASGMPASGDWVKVCNVTTSTLTPINSADPIGELSFDSSIVPNVWEVADGGGDFGYTNESASAITVIWPSDSENIANAGDLLVYVGENTFVIFNDSVNFYVSDETPEYLPINLQQYEYFNVGVTGSFLGYFDTNVSLTDKVLYVKPGVWTILNENVQEIPTDTVIENDLTDGDIVGISVEGNFGNTSKIYDSVKDCYFNDMLIYIESINRWVKLNKYSAYINRNSTELEVNSTRYYVNHTLGFNTDLQVIYNIDSLYFDVLIRDVYHGNILGTFEYNTGKLIFNNYILAKFRYDLEPSVHSGSTYIATLFNNYNETKLFDRIELKPTYKIVNRDGNIVTTTDLETDFDTLFNQYLLFDINPVSILGVS